MTQFFTQCTERNTWVISTLKVESLVELKFDPIFQVKMTPFFSQCTDLKNWVILTKKEESLAELKFDSTFQVKMTQFFLSVHQEKELTYFDLKSWVTGGIIIRLGKVSNWRLFESIWLSCWVNLTLNVESIWLSMLSQFDSQCWAN